MDNSGGYGPSKEEKYIASIDLGSHTARFLVCKIVEPPDLFRPVARKRFYTNLARGFNQEDACIINSDSIENAVNAIEVFVKMAEAYPVEKIVGAATGIFRRAVNSRDLLNDIKNRTGVEVRTVSGEDEAELTLKGISYALKLSDCPDAFFDLGGSTTEFIYKTGDERKVLSLPIGAFVLTDLFLKHDPPSEEEIGNLKNYIYIVLNKNIGKILNRSEKFSLIASGGTVTSLAAVMLKIDKTNVVPDAINGSFLNLDEIREFYEFLKPLSLNERLKIKGIDEGRAKVILAGTLAVLTIIEYFKTDNLKVSYSDILEGLIISHLEGVKNE